MIEYTNLGVFTPATWRIVLFTLEMRPFIPSIRGIQCCLAQLRNDRQLLTLILVLELVVFMLVNVGIGAWSVCLVSMLQQSMLARKVWLALASASLGSNKQPDESKTTLYSATDTQKPFPKCHGARQFRRGPYPLAKDQSQDYCCGVRRCFAPARIQCVFRQVGSSVTSGCIMTILDVIGRD